MGLFGKKKLSADEIIAGIEALSDEELARVKWALGGADEEPTEQTAEEAPEAAEAETDGTESEDPTPTTEPEEPAAEPAAEESAEAPPAEPAAAEPGAETPAEDAPTEGEPAEEATEEPEKGAASDDIAQIRAEVAKLTETVAALAARLDADAENNETDEEEPFGLAAGANGHEAPVEDELEAARKKHWNF